MINDGISLRTFLYNIYLSLDSCSESASVKSQVDDLKRNLRQSDEYGLGGLLVFDTQSFDMALLWDQTLNSLHPY